MINERDIILQPENVSFDKKYRLLKSTDPLIDMPESDYLLIKQMEEGLIDEERNRLSKINILHPKLIEDAVDYRKTRIGNEQIIYPQKSKLLKKTRTAAVHLWSAVGSVAAAAAILLFVLLPSDNNESKIILSETDTKNEIDLPGTNVKEQFVSVQKPDTVEKNKSAIALSSIVACSKEAGLNNMQPRIRHEIIASIPRPKFETWLDVEKVNAYETGLVTMVPKYLENYRLMQAMAQIEEEEEYLHYKEASIINAGIKLIKLITSRNIVFERVSLKDDLAENRMPS